MFVQRLDSAEIDKLVDRFCLTDLPSIEVEIVSFIAKEARRYMELYHQSFKDLLGAVRGVGVTADLLDSYEYYLNYAVDVLFVDDVSNEIVEGGYQKEEHCLSIQMIMSYSYQKYFHCLFILQRMVRGDYNPCVVYLIENLDRVQSMSDIEPDWVNELFLSDDSNEEYYHSKRRLEEFISHLDPTEQMHVETAPSSVTNH